MKHKNVKSIADMKDMFVEDCQKVELEDLTEIAKIVNSKLEGTGFASAALVEFVTNSNQLSFYNTDKEIYVSFTAESNPFVVLIENNKDSSEAIAMLAEVTFYGLASNKEIKVSFDLDITADKSIKEIFQFVKDQVDEFQHASILTKQ